MSTTIRDAGEALIDALSEAELREALHEVASAFHIGSLARTRSTILANVKNSASHAFCIKRPNQAAIARARELAPDDPLRRYIQDECSVELWDDQEELDR